MSFNLIDSVTKLLGSDFIPRASNMLGEDQNKMQTATAAIIPSILTGILNKAGSGEATTMLRLAKDTANSGILFSIGNFLASTGLLSKGAELLESLFGDRMRDVSNAISNFSGIKSTSATALMSVAAPAALGIIGERADSTNMNASGLLAFLNNEKDEILNAVPSGLNLAGALGLTNLAAIGNKLSTAVSTFTGQVRNMPRRRKTTSGMGWLVPVILIIAALGLLWYLLIKRNTDGNKTQATTANNADSAVVSAPPTSAPAYETIKVKLPNGVELDAYEGGIEDQLVSFLNDSSKNVDKNVWFDFDNLNFQTNSSTITTESMKQLQNIAAILKAFPNANIKIGGYTDKTGDEPANQKLSQARADAVLLALKNEGITSAQLAGAEGYGSQYAKAPANAPDEERKKDRRIAVSPRKK
jgi:outer membrane protein OmpA-like peptidoglycan-associated protein